MCSSDLGDKGMKAVSVTLTEPRKPRPEGEFGGGNGGYDRADRGYDERPAFRERREYRPRDAAPARPAGGDDRTKRKLERLISLLVEKGVIAPGEIDGVDAAAAAAEAKA